MADEKSEVDKQKENLAELTKVNDSMEAELMRKEELRAKIQQGGKSEAGAKINTPAEEIQEKAETEAKEIVDAFR